MLEPQSFKYISPCGECQVYDLDDLILYDKAYFYGCLKRKRDALTKRNISENDYFYAKIGKNGWEESNENYKRAKILLKSDWVKSNVTKFVDMYGTSKSIATIKPVLREAPPVLELEEHEKFRDEDENVYEVEVRGVREEDKIYFRGRDIEKLFEMDRLVDIVKQENTYTIVQDYEQFLLVKNTGDLCFGPIETKPVKRTFFTYNGLLKVIFRSNSGTAYRFRKWATKILYTAHLGTEEQRFEQALDIAGVNASLVKQVFDTCVTKVPCVYLFYVGKVSKMLKYYPELKQYRSGMVYKYGMTISLHRRLIEHIRDYGSLKESDLKLSQWSPINEKCISKAETALSRYFKDKKVPFQGHEEVIILSRTDMVDVKAKYMEIYNTFGIVTEMVKILTKNDKLVENHKYQKLMLQEKDARIDELNREIGIYQERETEWTKREAKWTNERKEWTKRETEWTKRETELLKIINKLSK
jgi:hypothetical protein